jgi:AcrR family transcriptional regulator
VAIRTAILSAARELLAQGGPDAITMASIAARAGVGKPTVYRWWPNRHAVAMAALMADEPAGQPARAARSPLRELRRQLHEIATQFSTPAGRHSAQMIAAADADSEIARAFRSQLVMAKRKEGVALIERARAVGEITRSMDAEVMADLLYGAILFRLLMGHAPLDTKFVDAVFDHVLRGFKE